MDDIIAGGVGEHTTSVVRSYAEDKSKQFMGEESSRQGRQRSNGKMNQCHYWNEPRDNKESETQEKLERFLLRSKMYCILES